MAEKQLTKALPKMAQGGQRAEHYEMAAYGNPDRVGPRARSR